ncbi:MAG: DUF1501 domain-containing protein [Byssovorax sp.]
MDRRRFLKIAGLAGLSVVAPVGLRPGNADPGKYGGPFFITVDAGGGWDPTMLCDPKGGTEGDKSTVNQSYTKGEIGKAGAFSYAPISYTAAGVEVFTGKKFFDAHHGKLLALNGVDNATNNHDAGSRTTWSGQLAEGYPSLMAMIAAAAAEKQALPMAYLSSGGYDATAGIISLTRIANVDALQRIAYPNVIDPNNADSPSYHTQQTASRIAAAQADRLKAMKDKQTLPVLAGSMGSLYLARESNDGLAALGAALKGKTIVTIDDFPDLAAIPGDQRYRVDDLRRLVQRADIAMTAFAAGVAVSANLSLGGFDTHNDNDNRQSAQLCQLLRGLDYIFTELGKRGLADKTFVFVGSDFGRTPSYNNENGKDHWNVTSMLFSGPGLPKDRVIGSTDGGFVPVPVDPSTLKESQSGIRIETKHIHRSLRKLAGLSGTPLDAQFPLAGDDLPLFEG